MLRLCLCLLSGAYALALFQSLPPDPALILTSIVTLSCLVIAELRLVGLVLLGFVLMWAASRQMLSDRLAPELQGQTLTVTVRVADFPEVVPGSVRFRAEVIGDAALPARIRLRWFDAPETPRLGEMWRLEARLKRPRGFANGAGFDYELWLARQGVGATGYVVANPSNRRMDVPIDFWSVLRQSLVDRIVTVTGENDASAVLLAVTVGALHLVSKEQWERYAISGTSHLMAISGLHIGLAAGGAWLLSRILFAAFCRSTSIRDLSAVAAVAAALLYAEISGFAVPARRAVLMALLVAVAFVVRRKMSPDKVLAASCLAVFASDPLSIHAPGFKLSFGAVAILLWIAQQRYYATANGVIAGRRKIKVYVERLSALQMTLLFGLFPMTALIFGRVSWLAPAINLLVLPFFNLVTVPAALAGLSLTGPLSRFGDALLQLAWHGVRLMLWIIEIAADWPPARTYTATATGGMLLVVLLSALWAAAPPGFPGRNLAWIAAISTLLYKPPQPPLACVDLVALEVGQGLSVVLRTGRRVLVFDTGPSFRGGSDIGQLVLVPWLRRAGINTIDLLVVSHSDDDHAGGAGSLVDSVDVTQIVSGELLPAIQRPQLRCRSGQAWLWDGIRFSFMHPGVYPLQNDNNASCVLEVAAGPYRILLTGDIESPVENHLARIEALHPVDIVIVPHHGSRTSSSAAFVSRLRPAVAIVSAGFENRWGFPKDDVVERWRKAGATVLNTATSGAIHYRVCAETGLRLLGEQRVVKRRYWHDRRE